MSRCPAAVVACLPAVLAVVLACATSPLPAAAKQTPPPLPVPAPAAPSRATSKTVTAVVVALDAERKTVRLKPTDAGASEVTAAVDPECEYTRKGITATLTAFAPGEKVVARLSFRTSPQEVVILRELWDEASYASEKRARTELCIGKVASATASAIVVKRGSDGQNVSFRVTEKTRIFKFDKPAPLQAFPAGEAVVVKPRGLPGGGVMATIIGSTEDEVVAAHLDTLIRWEGDIEAVEPNTPDGPMVTLLRSDGARRRILLAPGANLKQGRQVLTPARIPLGAFARVHLVKGGEKNGLRFADEIAIPARRTRAETTGTP